jgi:hypothetical protein
MANSPYAFARHFFAPEQVVISSCNYCLETVGESDDNARLDALEERHVCSQGLRASKALEKNVVWTRPAKASAPARRTQRTARTFTHRFYQPEQVVISSCDHCYAVVGESADDAVLESLEQKHVCALSLKAS